MASPGLVLGCIRCFKFWDLGLSSLEATHPSVWRLQRNQEETLFGAVPQRKGHNLFGDCSLRNFCFAHSSLAAVLLAQRRPFDMAPKFQWLTFDFWVLWATELSIGLRVRVSSLLQCPFSLLAHPKIQLPLKWLGPLGIFTKSPCTKGAPPFAGVRLLNLYILTSIVGLCEVHLSKFGLVSNWSPETFAWCPLGFPLLRRCFPLNSPKNQTRSITLQKSLRTPKKSLCQRQRKTLRNPAVA